MVIWLSFLLIAVPFVLLSTIVLLLAIWGFNKLFPERRIKFWRSLTISIAVPSAIVVVLYAVWFCESYIAGHSKENMDTHLAAMEMGIVLPDYKIVNHRCVQYGGFDTEDVFDIKFKGDSILALVPKLDSLCKEKEKRVVTARTTDGDLAISTKWRKEGNAYIYKLKNQGDLYFETLEICPSEKSATFIHYSY